MPLADDLACGLLSALDVVLATRLDQYPEQRWRVEHDLRRGDRDDRHVVEVLAERFAALTENPDDPKTPVIDAHPLAQRTLPTEQFPAQSGANHHDIGAPPGVERGQAFAAADRQVADREEIGGGADHRDLALAAAVRDRRIAHRQRRDPQNAAFAQQRHRIVQGQVARGGAEQRWCPAGGLGASGQHDQQVRAELRELADHVAARALAECGQQHHRGDTDTHREQHQQGAGACAAQRA